MAENIGNNGCLQRDSAQPGLLKAILYKDNFNRAYKRVKYIRCCERTAVSHRLLLDE